MKCVIDTNGLLKSVPKFGQYKWLYDAWLNEQFIWVFSNEILSEYAELIERRYSANAADFVLKILLTSQNHERFEPSFKWNLVDGYISFVSKTKLVEHYKETLGAKIFGGNRMYIDTFESLRLFKRYFPDEN